MTIHNRNEVQYGSSFEVHSGIVTLRTAIVMVIILQVIFGSVAFIYKQPFILLFDLAVVIYGFFKALSLKSNASKLRIYPDFIEYDKFTGGTETIDKDVIAHIKVTHPLHCQSSIVISYRNHSNEDRKLVLKSLYNLDGCVSHLKEMGYDAVWAKEISTYDRFYHWALIVISVAMIIAFIILKMYVFIALSVIFIIFVFYQKKAFEKR